MSVLDAKLEVEIDGTYKTISNIKEISLSITYKSGLDKTIRLNDWASLLSAGGTRDMVIAITGIVAPSHNTQEIQLLDFLLQNYCGDDDTQPVDSTAFKYRLTLPNGGKMETECSVAHFDVYLVTGDFDEYRARLESSGMPNYERVNNN